MQKLYDRLSAVCGIMLVLLVLNTVWDYGIAWDEWFRWQGGERKLEYYQVLVSGDFSRAAELRGANDSYPGLFDLSSLLLRGISPFGPAETSHLWTAVFGLAGLAGTWMLARLLGGSAAAFWALLFLALTPRYWGHMFFNPKDIPFAATYVWGVAALVWVLRSGPRPTAAAVFGFAAGLCMATRIGGLLLLCYGALFSSIQGLRQTLQQGFSMAGLLGEIRRRALWFLLASAVALAVLLPWWPRAHHNPFAATSGAVGQVTDFGWRGTVLFMGNDIPATEVPWYYLPVWIGITLPEWQWVLLLLACVYAIQACIRASRNASAPEEHRLLGYGLLAFAGLFPLGYIILRGSTVYDGMRHVLFLLPLFACICACAWTRVTHCARAAGGPWLWIMTGALLLPMATTLWTMHRMHPYQYVYFNTLAGGAAGAAGNYDLDYWGTAYREAVQQLEAFLQATEPRWHERTWTLAMVPPLEAIFARSDVAVVPPPILVSYYLPENIVLIEGDQHPDFFVAMNRFGYPDMMDGDIIVTVERMGATLAIVRDQRTLPAD